jgi:hypothetical protein
VQSAGTRHGGGWFLAVVLVLAGLGGAPGAAAAGAPSYQPDSPAGTEYAIPLDEARKTGSAAGSSGANDGSSAAQTSRSASGGDDAALFGEGIAPAKRSSGAAGRSHKPSKTATKATRSVATAPSDVGHLRPAASGISGTAVALGTGGLVLALGAALTGAIMMSRRTPRSR